MSALLSSPKVVKGGLFVLDAATDAIARMIALHYNPDTLTLTLQLHVAEGGWP